MIQQTSLIDTEMNIYFMCANKAEQTRRQPFNWHVVYALENVEEG